MHHASKCRPHEVEPDHTGKTQRDARSRRPVNRMGNTLGGESPTVPIDRPAEPASLEAEHASAAALGKQRTCSARNTIPQNATEKSSLRSESRSDYCTAIVARLEGSLSVPEVFKAETAK